MFKGVYIGVLNILTYSSLCQLKFIWREEYLFYTVLFCSGRFSKPNSGRSSLPLCGMNGLCWVSFLLAGWLDEF